MHINVDENVHVHNIHSIYIHTVAPAVYNLAGEPYGMSGMYSTYIIHGACH